jgi:von Willebrand factor type A domain
MLRSVLPRVLVVGLSMAALSGPLLAQSTERVLYVNALDAKTKAPIESLAAGDVRVTEDGRAREVVRVTPATTPMPVAVIVDNQAAAQRTIADLRNALLSFLADLDGVGPIALITTADRPTIVQDYTTDAAKLRDAANRIFAQPDSGATLLDAISEVSKGLSKREDDRAAIVLVTLELTEFSNLHYRQVLDELKSGGAMMSAVVLSNQLGSAQNDPARNRAVVLDRGVVDSGGVRVDVLTSMSYGGALKQVAGALKHQHRVVYSRPQTLIPPERIAVSAVKDGWSLTGAPARGQKER